MIARIKVKAGMRLSIAVPSVGELYFIPAYPNIWAKQLYQNKIINTMHSIKKEKIVINKERKEKDRLY